MNNKETLIRELSRRTKVEEPQVRAIIETLWSAKAIDGVGARRYIVREVFFDRAAATTESVESILCDLSVIYGMGRTSVQRTIAR